jgi:RNA polymerase sigma-70 factor, ECF subfamily
VISVISVANNPNTFEGGHHNKSNRNFREPFVFRSPITYDIGNRNPGMNAFDTCSDETLLQLTMAGDEEAFTRLYRRLRGVVFRFARRMSGSSSVAEDVTQEVFLILLRKAELYDPRRGSLSTYLIRIARNEILRRLDRDSAYVTLAEEDAAPDKKDKKTDENLIVRIDPLGNLVRNEEIESVRQAVLGLPLHYREVVVLCELEEMSYGEAAASLGCAVGTVRSRLHRARALLKQRLRGCDAVEQDTLQINRAGYF